MAEYLQCPYCNEFRGMHGKKVPKTVGRYRVKKVGDNILIFQCQKCLKTFRVKEMGNILLWDDMSHAEKIAFRQAEWIKKQRRKQKINEVKNGKKKI